ncbi:MAG TPA: PspC domain-containing protein [Chloroflexota bacterium]|nr:PspC domain-containing protein [Chloroflexota bacterium]
MDTARGKLHRARHGAWIAGVAKGLANWSGIPVSIIRLIWILLLLPGGVPGVIPYLLCWLLIPKAPRYSGY